MRRVVVVCPGRGSYGRDTRGCITDSPSVRAADTLRAGLGRPTPSEMDAAPWTSRLHLAGENASILTMAASLRDRDALRDVDVVAVIGNSMGWYTALAVAGALPLEDGLRLVETMGQYQADNVVGGQILYPLVDDAWHPDPVAVSAVDLAVASIAGLYWSIRLGGHAVLGGTDEALAEATKTLPPRKDAPTRLPLHSAFHTPLMTGTSARARTDLASLGWRAPAVPLVDGTGRVWRPRHADPGGLRDYTLTTQVVEPYDFTASVRVALAEYAPDAIVLLGPGGNLGGAVAQASMPWRGVRSKADLQALQAREPFVLAMARPDQRALVT